MLIVFSGGLWIRVQRRKKSQGRHYIPWGGGGGGQPCPAVFYRGYVRRNRSRVVLWGEHYWSDPSWRSFWCGFTSGTLGFVCGLHRSFTLSLFFLLHFPRFSFRPLVASAFYTLLYYLILFSDDSRVLGFFATWVSNEMSPLCFVFAGFCSGGVGGGGGGWSGGMEKGSIVSKRLLRSVQCFIHLLGVEMVEFHLSCLIINRRSCERWGRGTYI